MNFIHSIVQAVLAHSLAIAQSVQSSAQYPYALGAASFSLLLGIFNFAGTVLLRPSGRRMPGRVLWIEVRFLVVDELFPIALLWLAFATPYGDLPFPPPSNSAHWLFLPAYSTYVVAAVLLHGGIGVYGSVDLITSWLVQLRTPNQSRVDLFCFTASLLAVVYGWEIQHWPELFVVCCELVLSLLVAFWLAACVVGPRTVLAMRQAGSRVAQSAIRVYLFVGIFIWMVSLLFITLWHQIDWYVVNLTAIFFIATLLDACFVALSGSASYRRAFMLFPLTLILTVFAASGALIQFTHNSSISYMLWLEAGTAAAVYMLLFPLTEMARKATKASILQEGLMHTLEAFGSETADLLLPPGTTVVDSATTSGGEDDKASDNEDSKLAVDPAVRARLGREILIGAVQQAQIAYAALNSRVWFVLLAVVILYHFLAGTPDVLAALGGNLLTILFGALSLFAGLLALLASRDNEPARNVLLLLLMLTMAVISMDVVLNYTPAANSTVSGSAATLVSLFHDQHYLLATAHSICQELLVLLSLGQITYLAVVVNANLRRNEKNAETF